MLASGITSVFSVSIDEAREKLVTEDDEKTKEAVSS
jgi:phage anti-repressor protein